MTKFRKGWYVMYTRLHHERKALFQLGEKHIDCFLPTIKILAETRKDMVYRERPVFSSYVFVYLEQWRSYYESSRVEGYIRYVRFGNEIAIVPEKVIEQLKLITEHGSRIRIFPRDFAQEQPLTILRGPLSGMSCKFVKRNQRGAITVNLHLLGTDVSAIIPASYLNRWTDHPADHL